MMPKKPFWNTVMCALFVLAGAGTAEAQGPAAMGFASSGESGSAVSLVTSERGTGRSSFRVTDTQFGREQLQFPRVRNAQLRARPRLAARFQQANITQPAAEVFVRVFKRDRELEVWVRPEGATQFRHLTTYPICAAAGKPGPKQRQGDMQVPEGFYFIDLFNPVSQYHLSLRINYPNERDVRASNGRGRLGGDIYIHGDCVSAGCLALTDGGIEEMYWLAVEARAAGQTHIPVHIFPARIDEAELSRIAPMFSDQPELMEFWETLRPGYEYFEENRRLPRMTVDARGTYRLAATD
jgi:murein L,D-transpeptidase YafK